MDKVDALSARLARDLGECLLTLRCNVFWPMLSRQAYLASAGVGADERALRILETIADEPMSAAVIEAQLTSTPQEKLATLGHGIQQCGAPALKLAWMLARLSTRPDLLLVPLLERLVMGQEAVKEPRLFCEALVCAGGKEQRAPILAQGALYLACHRHLHEALFVCRKATHARKRVAEALSAPPFTDLARAFEAIWKHGLSPRTLEDLDGVAAQISEQDWATLRQRLPALI